MTIDTCECGGTMTMSAPPGRKWLYRGVECDVPTSIPTNTCSKCLDFTVTMSQTHAIQDELEAEFKRSIEATRGKVLLGLSAIFPGLRWDSK